MSQEGYLRALARHSHDIRTGALGFDYRTGQCFAPPAAVPMSWGPSCPSGWCPPDNLPEALGRYFAGDRAGCREIPYGFHITGTSEDTATGAAVTVEADFTAKVTMCPTRMITVVDEATAGQWLLQSIDFGNQRELVGDLVPLETWGSQAFQLVPMVPDCIKAGQPISFSLVLGTETTGQAREAWIVFIGPMVG